MIRVGTRGSALALAQASWVGERLSDAYEIVTIDALVPPNPNELESTQPSATLSRRSRTIGTSAKTGSSVSILALSQMKPLFIISSE